MMSLVDAIISERPDHVTRLLQNGASANEIDEYGFTPLIEAAVVDSLELAQLLIQHGADVNGIDATGGTALQWAAENNNMPLATLLLKKGANPNAYRFSGQPVLVMPLLRQQEPMKELLLAAGADLRFSQDFVNTKLLGHLFELVGTANIVDPKNRFVELDFEGFFLEFSLAVISESMLQFKNHFAARKLRRYSPIIQFIAETLDRAGQLIRYQQYRTDITKHIAHIRSLIQQEPLIIPIGYEGHAITFVKAGDILVKCDRREDSRLYDNIVFYKIGHPKRMSPDFIQDFIYTKKSSQMVNDELPRFLGLTPLTELKVPAQISGNCSWANVEACIPVLFYLSLPPLAEESAQQKGMALNFFKQWREWYKDLVLSLCLQSIGQADPIRKACKAEILAAILYQSYREDQAVMMDRREEILSILSEPRYKHVLMNYVTAYCYEDHSPQGQRFLAMLRQQGFLR